MRIAMRNMRVWIVAAALWVALVSGLLLPQFAAPHVEPMGVTFREDTSGVELFPLGGADFASIEAAVASGRLAAADLSDGFRVFMRGTLSRAAQAARVKVAQRVVDQHVGELQWAARMQLLPLWAALALLPATVLLGTGAALTRRRIRPAVAGP